VPALLSRLFASFVLEILAKVTFLDGYPDQEANERKRAFLQRRGLTRLYEALRG
jgi:hypothetical protein